MNKVGGVTKVIEEAEVEVAKIAQENCNDPPDKWILEKIFFLFFKGYGQILRNSKRGGDKLLRCKLIKVVSKEVYLALWRVGM